MPWYIQRFGSSPKSLAVGLAVGALLGGASFLVWPKQYVSTARVLFGGGSGLSLPAGLSLGGGGGGTAPRLDSLLGFGQARSPSNDIVHAILTSEGASSQVLDKYHLQTALGLPGSRSLSLQTIAKKHLGVRKIRTVEIEVSFRAPTAQLAHDCVAEYLHYCDEYTSKNAVTSSRRTRLFIDGKVKENEQQIQYLERRLSAFLDSKGLQLMQAQPEVGGKMLADAAKAHFESQAQAAALRTRVDSLAYRSSQALETARADLASPIEAADPLVVQTQTSLVRAQLELDSLELTMTAAHPKVKEARLKVTELQSQLELRLRLAAQAAQSRQSPELVATAAAADSADTLRDRQEKQFADTVRDLRQSAGLVVQQQVLKASLEGLLRKRELLLTEQTRARIQEEQESLELEVLDPPSLPDRHDWPKRSLLLIGGGLLGLSLAALWNFWRGVARR